MLSCRAEERSRMLMAQFKYNITATVRLHVGTDVGTSHVGITTVQQVPLFLLRWSIAYLIGYSLSYQSPHTKVTRGDWVRGIVTESDRGLTGLSHYPSILEEILRTWPELESTV